jgi:hypothetical protein
VLNIYGLNDKIKLLVPLVLPSKTYNPKTNGKKSWFRQEWFKCGMSWFTSNENFSFSAFGASDG